MPVPRWRILTAFAAIYLIWGSSYLAIQISIETLPPLTSSSIRFMIAGAVLMIWAQVRGQSWPTRQQWLVGSLSGAFLFLVASGGVTWATQYVPSSMVALIPAGFTPTENWA